MSITGQVLLRCDVCREGTVISEPGEQTEELRKRVTKRLGWKQQRGQYENGTAILDICPKCGNA